MVVEPAYNNVTATSETIWPFCEMWLKVFLRPLLSPLTYCLEQDYQNVSLKSLLPPFVWSPKEISVFQVWLFTTISSNLKNHFDPLPKKKNIFQLVEDLP